MHRATYAMTARAHDESVFRLRSYSWYANGLAVLVSVGMVLNLPSALCLAHPCVHAGLQDLGTAQHDHNHRWFSDLCAQLLLHVSASGVDPGGPGQ